MPKIYLSLFLVLVAFTCRAQTWEVGGSAGGSGYIGDINQNNPFKLSGGGGSAFVKYNFDGYFGLKAQVAFGRLAGADSTSGSEQQRLRNLSFATPFTEISLRGEFHFMKYIPDVTKDKYTPYVFLGIGSTAFNPYTKYQGERVELRPLRTEAQDAEYKGTIVIPYGAGFKYNFSGKWTVGAELGYRFTFTDYLDDISGFYPDKNRLNANILSPVLSDRSAERTGVSIGVPNTQRGDLRPRDTYMFLGFTLSYTFVTDKCYYEN